MKIKTHLMIVDYAYNIVNMYIPFNINQQWLKIGAASPDLFPTRRFAKHNVTQIFKVQAKLQNTQKSDWRLAYKMGVISHYTSDCLCYAHRFTMGLRGHLVYEINLQEQCRLLVRKKEIVKIEEVFREYNKLKNVGAYEYMIEARKKHLEQIGEIKRKKDIFSADIIASILYSAVWLLYATDLAYDEGIGF